MSSPGDDTEDRKSDDELQDCEQPEDKNRLKPAGEAVVKQHPEAQPPPPGKTIHPRRPLPPVPEKAPTKNSKQSGPEETRWQTKPDLPFA